MKPQFFSQLSENFINILEDDKYYDITIEVGIDPEVKIFRAHMVILNYRSAYFRRTLSTNERNNDGALAHLKLQSISPNIFQIILKYIYGGTLFLDEVESLDVFNILVAAETLKLQEIVDYLESYLIKSKAKWMEENFSLIYNTIFQHNSFIELQTFCTDIMSRYPEKIFKSFDFTAIHEKSLISLIKRDDLKMEEIEVWENILKWGLAQNPTLFPDPDTWLDDDFRSMESTLQKCLPFVRFFQLSSKDFLEKVTPYKKLFRSQLSQLYIDLIKYYPDEEVNNIVSTIQPARGLSIDSKLITNKIAAYIASWIDRKETNHPMYGYIPYNTLDIPYEFKLLYRGSRDGFSPENFHKLCDNKPKTVTIVKVKGTNEILGGYNPNIWESSDEDKWSSTDLSFIFSFTFMNLKDVVLSRVKDYDHAIASNVRCGPSFGYDFLIIGDEYGGCFNEFYKVNIRAIEGEFDIEEHEIFQIFTKTTH